MKQPLILITGGTGAAANGTPTWNLNQNYADNIVRAGGLPILAVNNDNAEAYAELADGLLLSGGKDVDPALYGQELKYDFVIMDKQRDDLEWKLVKAFIEKKKPIWGICRGIQLLNTAMGGTLYQDIPSQFEADLSIAHRQPFAYKVPSHTVDVIPGTLLSRILGEDHASIAVNSMHHQAIKDLAPGLEVCGYAPDKMIEAVYAPDYPFLLGVQWHPEHLVSTQQEAAKLFAAFVEACR